MFIAENSVPPRAPFGGAGGLWLLKGELIPAPPNGAGGETDSGFTNDGARYGVMDVNDPAHSFC